MLRNLIMLILLTASANAAAYLDPGTGSLILQGLIAAIAVAGMTIRNYWYKITSWFGGADRKNTLLDDEEPERENDH